MINTNSLESAARYALDTGNQTRILLVLLALGLLLSLAVPSLRSSTFHVASGDSDPISTGNATYDQYDSIIVQLSQQNGLNPFIIKGQIMLESGFNQYAQSSVINAGCGWTYDLGLMQVNPYCNGVSASSLYQPWTNIEIGTSVMGQLYNEFGNIDLALQAYNIGSTAVAAGQRNWAYSDGVENYAQQFETMHNALNQGSGSGGFTYTVQPGDSLYSIGQNYGVSWTSIAQANGIYSPYTIYVGQQLWIPSSSGGSSSSSSGSWTYTVQPGDSLYSIGQTYGVSWQTIAQDNGIYAPYTIYVGQQLTIP